MLTTIKHKSKGDAVKIAQYLTKYTARGNADGIFSADFVAHVCTWQRENGLNPDGIIGPKTWTKLAATAPTCSTAKNKTSRYTCALQIALDTGLTADGIFGSKTKKAVAAYQAAKNLKADGICGPKTWTALLTDPVEVDAPETAKIFKQPVDYKQGDSRWGKKMYSSQNSAKQTMANSGCGPTAMADIVATLKDPNIDPYDLAQLAVANGHRSKTGGTAWSFFPYIQEKFKFSKMVQTTSLATLKACLDSGGYVVCSMGPGYWTSGGHFICVWKYDGTYIHANDPASSKRKKQKQSQFVKERKQYFCFYP